MALSRGDQRIGPITHVETLVRPNFLHTRRDSCVNEENITVSVSLKT